MSTKDLKKGSENKEVNDETERLVDFLFSEIGIEIDDPESKSKTSFYITRLTQILLKILSDAYGISQGDLINKTPLFFTYIMQRSLERRKRTIATLRTLEQQIQSSIEAMRSVAPHLSLLLHYPDEMISQLVDLEEKAVEEKVISGLGVKKFDEGLFSILHEPFESEPAYQRDLDEVMGGINIGDLFPKVILQTLPKKEETADESEKDKPCAGSK